MKQFYLVANSEKEKTKQMALEIQEYLTAHGCQCRILAGILKEQMEGAKDMDWPLPADTECVITLGGDGTLIQAARILAGRRIPLLGVNLGTLGYLTQVGGADDIPAMLDALIHGEYRLERRMMLKGTAFHDGKAIRSDVALNEIVITRKGLLHVLRFRLYVNEEVLSEYAADGIIVATPTGSTAYNLSAGGPIVEPCARMVLLTPICSHSLNSRSIVLSAEDRIKIEICSSISGDGQVAVFDGESVVELQVGDYIEIEQASMETMMVKIRNTSFLDNLRSKMAGI